ncbi:hypothetical protein SAMN05421539_10214 [Jannaschia seohaensis]|uniref:Transposase n=1 Tax=Jannaschia seohaensis TaxID=475081 RepID=A0A2Y9AA51_9RHOB|nr:hypothetical protein BCF38_10214 [Jannaschia seohaensis]SSA41125.1 hypothetical protein SAMN05421539_10214 [Jannaschia seohaensis]
MGEVTIIGVDLAKNAFLVHGAAADGSVLFRKKAVTAAVHPFHGGTAAELRGDGSLRQRASLGATDDAAGS